VKLKIGIAIFLVVSLIIFAVFYRANDAEVVDAIPSVPPTLAVQAEKVNVTVSYSSSLSSGSSVNAVSFSVASSLKSLSGERVSPLSEITYFLGKMDEAIIPKIYLPTPQRDPSFNYFKGKPSEFREKALAGDPYAAYSYAEFIVRNGVRTLTDKGTYAYESDQKKRELAMAEAREFYVRALRGGIASVADVLSRLYVSPVYGDRIESLAWRKISFAVGESERYNCLRNSTTCVVKDFNNLNRLELFYPCLSSAKGDSCAQSEYEQAMTRAFQYADSLEFAMYNKPQQ
jgi:hypothetical protein